MLDINIPGVNYLVYIGVNLVILVGVIGLLTFFYDYIHDLLSMTRTNTKNNKDENAEKYRADIRGEGGIINVK